jgi:mono/diheme cytochrome c family protein
MKKLLKIVLAGSLMLSYFSCYYDDVLDIEVPVPDAVSYQSDIQPIFDAHCVNCHSGTTAPDLRDGESYTALLNGYVVPSDAASSTLYKSLLNLDGVSLMPPAGQLTDYDIGLVEKWINDGALDN